MERKDRIRLIKIGCLEKGISFVDIAKEMKCTRQNVSRTARGISKGRKGKNIKIREQLAQIAGYTCEDFWGDHSF